MLRHQLPAYSPLEFKRLAGATFRSLVAGEEAIEELRQYLSNRFEADEVVLTGSGTQALQLAMIQAVKERGSGAIALPAYSCFDLITAAVGANVQVRFYDIDPVSLTPDMESVRKVLREGVVAMVAANLYGYPLDWDSIRAVCDEVGALLIEDAAQGLGSTWKGREGGRFGDLTVLSFGRGKGWTGGGGGALLSRAAAGGPEPHPLRGVQSTRSALALWVQWALGRPSLYGIPASLPWLHLGETRYHAPTRPHRMAALAATTILAHAEATLDEVKKRRETAERLYGAFGSVVAGTAFEACTAAPGGSSAFLRLPVLARSRCHASTAAVSGAASGLAQGYPMVLPGLALEVGIHDGVRAGEMPGAELAVERLILLPTHSLTTADDRTQAMRRIDQAEVLEPPALEGPRPSGCETG